MYLVPPVAAALLVYFFARRVQRFPRTLLIFDAGGLALFCAAGEVTALDAGINPVSAALLGVTTGVGGGCWVTSSQTGQDLAGGTGPA